MLPLIIALAVSTTPAPAREEPVDPYVMSDANAAATPFAHDRVYEAFNGKAGVARVVADLIRLSVDDPRIGEIFKGQDLVRLDRTLNEQFCYILGGGCTYSGRDMKSAHKDLGIQTADFNALVENLQKAMDREGVPFAAQNRLLAKLAPMKRMAVER